MSFRLLAQPPRHPDKHPYRIRLQCVAHAAHSCPEAERATLPSAVSVVRLDPRRGLRTRRRPRGRSTLHHPQRVFARGYRYMGPPRCPASCRLPERAQPGARLRARRERLSTAWLRGQDATHAGDAAGPDFRQSPHRIGRPGCSLRKRYCMGSALLAGWIRESCHAACVVARLTETCCASLRPCLLRSGHRLQVDCLHPRRDCPVRSRYQQRVVTRKRTWSMSMWRRSMPLQYGKCTTCKGFIQQA